MATEALDLLKGNSGAYVWSLLARPPGNSGTLRQSTNAVPKLPIKAPQDAAANSQRCYELVIFKNFQGNTALQHLSDTTQMYYFFKWLLNCEDSNANCWSQLLNKQNR